MPDSTPATSQPAAQPTPTPPVVQQPQGAKAVPAESGLPKPVAKPLDKAQEAVAKKHKVKVDNREIEVDEAELINNYQLRQLSDKKRSEAEKTMQEYTKLFEHLKGDPIKFMKAAGIDFDNLSTSYLAKKAEEAMLDPKERELQQARAEAEQYKKWVNEQKEAQAKAAKSSAMEAERSRLHSEIIQAIEERKAEGLPVDEHLVIQVAQDMMIQDKGKQPLSAKEALPKTYERTQKWLQGLASKMEGENLVKWLGQDAANKIRKYDLAQLKAKRLAASPQSGSSLVKPKEHSQEKANRPMTWSEFKKTKLDTIQ